MARSFTDQEKKLIDSRLVQKASELLKTQGARKTTVEELARLAGISKGAFYQFYSSKEELFFHVFMAFHEQTDAMLSEGLASLSPVTPDGVAGILCAIFNKTASSFIPRLVSAGDLDYILRSLPEEVYASHLSHDEEFVLSIIKALSPSVLVTDVQVMVSCYAAALRGLFFIVLHRAEIGEEFCEAALEIHVRALINQLWNDIRKGEA